MANKPSSLPLNRSKYLHWIGIDPGVNTGIALWRRDVRSLVVVKSMPIHKAIAWISDFPSHETFIRIEDARLRKWFGISGPERWKGAGSICRDCGIWEDVLKDLLFEYDLVPPKKNLTKTDHRFFQELTGWSKPTSEHSRDAAMLVYGY